MEFYINYGTPQVKDFYCPERPYSIHAEMQFEKPIDSIFANFILLHEPDYISMKRIYTYIDKCYKYVFTISLTGTSTKHEVVEKGLLTYLVAVEINQNEISCSPKANIQLSGAFLERVLDLLGKKREYSLLPLTLDFDLLSILKRKYKQMMEEESEDPLQIQEYNMTTKRKVEHIDFFFCLI